VPGLVGFSELVDLRIVLQRQTDVVEAVQEPVLVEFVDLEGSIRDS